MKNKVLIQLLQLVIIPALTCANPLKVTTDIRGGLEQDNRVVCYNNKAYLIERAGYFASGDCTITVIPLIDLSGSPETSYSVGIGANAYDIEFRDIYRAYVSRYGNKEILIIDPTDGSEEGTIDLGPYCSIGATPSYMYMAQRVENYALKESRLFVAVQDGWGNHGKVIVFDTLNDDNYLTTIELSLSNPNADLDYYDGNLYVSCAGDYSTPSLCGIEVIDILAEDGYGNYTYPTSFLSTGDQLESDATSVHDIEIANSEWGFAVVAKDAGSQQNIIVFHPLTGSRIKSLYTDYSIEYTHEMKAYMPGYLFIARSDKDASTGTDIPVYDFIYDVWYNPFPSAGNEEACSITAHNDRVVLLTSNYNWQNPGGYLTSIELDNGELLFSASQIVDFSPGSGAGFGSEENVLGEHDGDLLTLGDSGSIILGFDHTITDGTGSDFTVFENAFMHNWPPGYTPGYFCELAFVEVSTNGSDFVRFPSRTLNNYPVSSYAHINPLEYFGFAGVTVAQVGVHFDLADLEDNSLVIDGTVNLSNINYVRIVDIIGDGNTLDYYNNPIYDPYLLTGDTCGFDLDAVEVIMPLIPSTSSSTTTSTASSSSTTTSTAHTSSTTTSAVVPPPLTTTTSTISPTPTSTTTTSKTTSSTTSTTPSTTTTISSLWPVAYDKMWGSKTNKHLSTLRGFRDRVLVRTEAGNRYIFMIYQNSIEIALLLIQELSLTRQLCCVIDELLPLIQSYLNNFDASISQSTVKRFESLINNIEPNASPQLKMLLIKAKKDITTGKIFKELGITLNR